MADTTPFPPAGPEPTLPAEDPAERLRRLWDEGWPPDVETFLARAGPLAPDQLAAVLRVDQRARWRAGERVPAEDYLRRFPAVLESDEAALDLVFNEFLLREEQRDAPDVEDYARRFPRLAAAVRAQAELQQALETATRIGPASEAPPPSRVTWPVLPRQFGRYRVERLLGEGGMGEVYLAQDTQLNRPVALKLPSLGDDPERLARFFREARIAAGFTDPALCPVYDVGAIDGVHYFTMPFLDGETLADRLRLQGPLPVDEAIRLAARVARALALAHAAGVVHRDLKPSNLMLTANGDPVVLDFGLARRVAEGRLTATGTLMGTPAYMAPEQVGGRPEDLGPACDVYSLGAVLYDALTGEPPFPGPVHDALRRCLTESPRPPSRRRPGLAARLDDICLTALARQPARRFASMTAFAEALEGCLRPGVASTPARRLPGRRAVLLAAAGLALAVAAGLAGHAWLTRNPFPAGSRWQGDFLFRPPIENYGGDVAIDVESRDGETFTGRYTSENGDYCWRIAGTVRGGEVRWRFTEVVREKEPQNVVSSARGEGRLSGDELVGLFSDADSTADLRLRKVK
jgi:serine/threonine-protein kinase